MKYFIVNSKGDQTQISKRDWEDLLKVFPDLDYVVPETWTTLIVDRRLGNDEEE